MEFGLHVHPIVWIALGLLGLVSVYRSVRGRRAGAYETLPWVGLPNGPLPRLRAFFDPADAREQFSWAYKEYSLKGKSFAWQGLLAPPLAVLPPAQIPWLTGQPDHVLNATKFFDDKAFGHALLDNTLLHDGLHEHVVRTELTRALGLTIDPVADEVEAILRERLGRSEEWQEIEVRDLMTAVYARTSVRTFSGVELARNEDFTKEVVQFANLSIATSFLLQPFPAALRPLAGLAILHPSRRCYRRLSRHLLPHVDQRVADLERAARDPACKPDAPPHDLLQWLIAASRASPNRANRDRHRICRRYLGCTNAAIHTTAIMASHVLFDLAAAPPALGAIAALRAEIAAVRAQQGARGWTKPALTQLRGLDSAIRESLRLGVLAATTMGRVVVAPAGVTLPDRTWARPGTHLGVHAFGPHFLDKTYPNPETYDPFRFSRSREHGAAAGGAASAEEKAGADANGATPEGEAPEPSWQRRGAASAASPEFLTFGYGKHACPGRFFAVAELKLFLIEFLTKYDMQPLQERPPRQWLRDVQAPNTTVKLKVRSRVD